MSSTLPAVPSTAAPVPVSAPAAPREYQPGDLVLYRDPAQYWTGRAVHTRVCTVLYREDRRYGQILKAEDTGEIIQRVDERYMRLLRPEECMAGLDAPPAPAGQLTTAATAHLERL